MTDPDMCGHCPACNAELDYIRWGEALECPYCGAMVQHRHDCEWDSETQEGDCYDYLEAVTDG